MKMTLSDSLLKKVIDLVEGSLQILLVNLVEFEQWAEGASGCDWCCGGGDDWSHDLDDELKQVGFDSWDSLESHLQGVLATVG